MSQLITLQKMRHNQTRIEVQLAAQILEDCNEILACQSQLSCYVIELQGAEDSLNSCLKNLRKQRLIFVDQKQILSRQIIQHNSLNEDLRALNEQFWIDVHMERFKHLLVVDLASEDFRRLYQQLLQVADSNSSRHLNQIQQQIFSRCDADIQSIFHTAVDRFISMFRFTLRSNNSLKPSDIIDIFLSVDQKCLLNPISRYRFVVSQFFSLNDYLSRRNEAVAQVKAEFCYYFEHQKFAPTSISFENIRQTRIFKLAKSCKFIAKDQLVSQLLVNQQLHFAFQNAGLLRFKVLMELIAELFQHEEIYLSIFFDIGRLLQGNIDVSEIELKFVELIPNMTIADCVNAIVDLDILVRMNEGISQSLIFNFAFQLNQLLFNQFLRQIAHHYNWFFHSSELLQLVNAISYTENSVPIFVQLSKQQAHQQIQELNFRESVVYLGEVTLDKKLLLELLVLNDNFYELKHVKTFMPLQQQLSMYFFESQKRFFEIIASFYQ